MLDPQKITMVVARYNEDLSWLIGLPWNCTVFNKGGELPRWVRNEIKLPNIGREAHSYLTYIINNYDNLPDYTAFVQGNPFDHARELIKTINDFDGEDNFFSLSDSLWFSKQISDNLWIDNDGHQTETWPELAMSMEELFLDDIKSFKYIEYPEGAQFIVSKKTILFHTKTTYQKLINSITNKENIIDGIFTPIIMEVLWKTLFDNEHKTKYDQIFY